MCSVTPSLVCNQLYDGFDSNYYADQAIQPDILGTIRRTYRTYTSTCSMIGNVAVIYNEYDNESLNGPGEDPDYVHYTLHKASTFVNIQYYEHCGAQLVFIHPNQTDVISGFHNM